MRVIILDDDDVIDGVPRVAGEVVTVVDDYGGTVRRVVVERVEQRNRVDTESKIEQIKERKRSEMFREALAKLQAILQADYPQFWAALQKRPAVQEQIIDEMRDNPEILRRALEDPQWFVDEVTRRLGKARNAQ